MIRCISCRLISVALVLASASRIELCAAFQLAKRPSISRTRLREREVADFDDRRAFLRKSLAATSTVFVAALATMPDAAFAADDDGSSPSPSATTPSVSEGELIPSEPPPNRAKAETRARTRNGEKEKGKAGDPRFFVAGGASAALSHGIATPIDVVKTRMQSDPALRDASPSDAALRIVGDEGVGALTAGLGPTVVGYGVEGALKFGAYESLKPAFLSWLPPGAPSGGAYLAAAVCAGALAGVVLCPMEETRIKLVADPTFGAEGLLDGLPKLLKEEGALAPFRRGIAPMLSKQVPYTMGKQVSFDLFAGMLYSFLIGLSFVPQKEIALEVEVGAAFLASIVACLSSHPGDVLLTATYKDGNASDNAGFGSTIRRVYDEGGGIPAFFRGLNARFLHVGCIITFQLVIYDQLKQALGLPASGS